MDTKSLISKNTSKSSKTTAIIIGICIAAVLILFLALRYYNKQHSTIDKLLSKADSFQNSDKSPAIQVATALDIYSQDGSIQLLSSDELSTGFAKFYAADDYHQIQITFETVSDMNRFLANAKTLTVVLIDLGNKIPMESTKYTLQNSYPDFNINTSTAKIIINRTLFENTRYNIIIESDASPSVANIDKTFGTDMNVFYYGTVLSNSSINNDTTADKNLCLGIKLESSKGEPFKYNTISANSINYGTGFNGLIKYVLRKPIMDTFKVMMTEFTFSNKADSQANSAKLAEFDKYIPYKFDINLDFTRISDEYPQEVIKTPDILCSSNPDSETPCVLALLNLRPNQTYLLKCRLIYMKLGTKNNYRSTPVLETTFTTPALTGSDPLDYLKQIKNLLLNVKQQSVDIKSFNEYQLVQDKQLDELDSIIKAKATF